MTLIYVASRYFESKKKTWM